MSKTEDNPKGCITILEDPNSAYKKIMSAVTDSQMQVKYDVENKPGISNLLTIYTLLTSTTIKDAEEKFKDANYGTFKKEDFLSDLQKKYQEIINSNLIDEVLDEGLKKSEKIAAIKLQEVYQKIGLER